MKRSLNNTGWQYRMTAMTDKKRHFLLKYFIVGYFASFKVHCQIKKFVLHSMHDNLSGSLCFPFKYRVNFVYHDEKTKSFS